MTTQFRTGQLVRITNARSLAYGRIAMVMTAKGKARSLVRFTDLPKPVSGSHNPTGFVETFSNVDLILIEDIPIASLYLLVTIATYPLSGHCYHELCLAHSNGRKHEQLANSVAQHWYRSSSDWNEEGKAYVFLLDRRIEVVADNWEEISIAQYIQLRRWMKDCTPGYTGYAAGINGGGL